MAARFWMLTVLCIYTSKLSSQIGIASRATLTQSECLVDGQTLVSTNQRFEMGFFCPSNPCKDIKFLGIWYKDVNPLTVVWVANRKKPLKKWAGGRLVVVEDGGLLVQDSWRRTIWRVPKKSTINVTSPILQLLDSGNLVVRDGNNSLRGGHIWESFNHPGDTLLPGMKLGWDNESGMHRAITSWKSPDDPSYGEFSFGLDQSVHSSQLVLTKNRVRVSRWGPWDGKGFSGTNGFTDSQLLRTTLTFDDSKLSLSYQVLNDSVLLRFVVTSFGNLQFLGWKNDTKDWFPVVTLNKDSCDRIRACGPYGICYNDDPSCRCLEWFVGNYQPKDWCGLECSRGCKRQHELNCSNGEGFLKYKGLKLPDNSTVWPNLSAEECGEVCLKDCNCMAYTKLNVYGNGSMCVVWLSELIGIRRFPPGGGNDIYIRMSSRDLDSIIFSKRRKEALLSVTLLFSTISAALLVVIITRLICHLLKRAKQREEHERFPLREMRGSEEEDSDFHFFELEEIATATNNFSPSNKIGQGGFGIVYKGALPSGEEVAVKRLSESSWQGIREFKNEVTLIAKLQHRNLVKLLGYCIEGNERMLVYEYLPNRSLDQIIFEEVRKRLLSWETCFKIMKGVAKGLLYLHDDSRLRIIHRDLKASNILLDSEMNPKISDFGLAKIFEGETEETTKRVIGTHGYMSPEYIMNGHFSAKSDVYSFGVLALEIVSGKRNWGFQHPDHELNLLGHAWKLWVEGRPLELMDPVLAETVQIDEMLRCIHMGLLCVQQRPDDRPTMSEVVNMQQCETQPALPEPQEPGFFSGRSMMGLGLTSIGRNLDNTVNDVTMTTLTGR